MPQHYYYYYYYLFISMSSIWPILVVVHRLIVHVLHIILHKGHQSVNS